jgi:hypothetical protein
MKTEGASLPGLIPRWLNAWIYNRRWLGKALIISISVHIIVGLLFRVRSNVVLPPETPFVRVQYAPELEFEAGSPGDPDSIGVWREDPTLFSLPHEDGFSREWLSDRPILVVSPQAEILPVPQLEMHAPGPISDPAELSVTQLGLGRDAMLPATGEGAFLAPGPRMIHVSTSSGWVREWPAPPGLDSLLDQAPVSGRTVLCIAVSPSGVPSMVLVERSCGVKGLDEWGRAWVRGIIPEIPQPPPADQPPSVSNPVSDLRWVTVTLGWPFSPGVPS